MPIPTPHDDESKQDFIDRCMAAIGGEYDDEKQAAAVCYTQWKERSAPGRQQRMVLRAEIGAADDARAVTVTCSTETLGRDDIVLLSSGIELDRYRQNPVFLFQHNPDWPVARAEQIDVADGKLIARVQFPPQGVSQRADEVLGLIRAGVINAASTGFETKAAEPIDPRDPKRGVRITKCELQEVSFVSIPAVPDALITERALEEIRRMATKKRATEDWKCGAARDLAIDDSEEWDGQAAEDSIFAYAGGDDFDPEKAKHGFLLYNAGNPKERGSYKLPFARAVDGELKAVTEGLRAAASRLPQTDAPENELDAAKAVLDHYEEKAGVGEDKERAAKLRRGLIKRGLYEVGTLAYVLEQLGWVKDCSEWEQSVENDASQVPAMLGDALKQVGAALVAMTQEEVAELIGGVDVEVAEPDEEVIVEQSAKPGLARFRIGIHRARSVLTRRAAKKAPASRSMVLHRRMAALYERELSHTG